MIQYEEIEYCKVKVHYQAEQDLVSEKIEETVRELKKAKPKVPGFREAIKNSATKKKKAGRKGKGGRTRGFRSSGKGKMIGSPAYERSLRQRYKQHISDSVKRELVAEANDEVLFETKMKSVGYPEVLHSDLDGNDFSCDLLFLKKPDFELGEYKGIEVPKPHSDKTETEIAEKMLQMLREQHGELATYEEGDTVQMGDKITVDFLAEIDGEKSEELTKEGFLHKVGENSIEGFDDHLVGMKVGEERSFEIKMGDNFIPKFRGKTANFTAKLHMGTKNIPCPLDDSLAEKVGLKNLDELTKEVNGSATTQLKQEQEGELSQQLINKLLEMHDFKVPEFLVKEESRVMAAQLGAKWEDLSDEHKQMANEKAEKSVKLSMILDSIREDEPDATLADSEIFEMIKDNVAKRGIDPNKFLSSAQKDGTLFGLVAQYKDEATLKWLVTQSKIID